MLPHGKYPSTSSSVRLVSLISIFIFILSFSTYTSTGIRYIEENTFYGSGPANPANITVIGDLDNDGFLDIVMTQPMSSAYTITGGTAYLFFGSEGGFGEIRPSNADIIFHGGAGDMLSSSVAMWDSEGTGWSELVFGCPGDDNGNGTALVFDSALVNGSPSGTVLGDDRAQTVLKGTDTYGFGRWMETGHFTDSGTHELVILSMEMNPVEAGVHLFTGDGSLEDVEETDLPSLSVEHNTYTTSMDLMGRGKDALVYSTPDRAEVKIVYLDVTTGLNTEIKEMTGASGLGSTLFSGDIDGDGLDDLAIGNAKNSRVRLFIGNDTHWDSTAINADMANFTIIGEGNSGLGTSMAIVEPSPFTPQKALLVSQPWITGDKGIGAVASFDLPLDEEFISPPTHAYVLHAPNGTHFGISINAIGDTNSDSYPEFIVGSHDSMGRLNLIKFDRGANPPSLSLDSPSREKPLQGTLEIKATVTDIDGDASPWDVIFYRSIDNKSWARIGNGTPDRVDGDQAVKVWNTSQDENRIYFLKIEVTDSFGLTTERYSNSVTVFNHEPPSILLIYPIGGTTLKGSEEITARVILSEGEEIDPPVRFFHSRDGVNWTEFGNASEPNPDSDVDYTYLLDTTMMEDGQIYFKANATTVYGLGKEAKNDIPCFIDNAFPPVIEFTGNYSGTIEGGLNITARVSDRDDDIDPPVELFYRDPDVVAWELLGNMTGPLENDTYYYQLDTTILDNGIYQLRIHAQDLTFNQNETVLNRSIKIHNLYTPEVEIRGVNSSSVLTGIPRLRAAIYDRDGNYNQSGISFYYRETSVEVWNRIPQVLLNSGIATVDWDTSSLSNGNYDLMAEVTDEDGLIGSDIVEGVTVKNVRAPDVEGKIPSVAGKLSGDVVINFNITDDQEISVDNIIVEVFVLSEWVELEGVERTDPGVTFVPGKPVYYRLLWNTAAVDERGDRKYPDAPGYELRITVTDPDGETDTWTTPISFRIDNTEISPPDDDDVGDDRTLNTGLVALIAFGVIILIAILIIALIIWKGRASEKKGSLPVVETSRKKKEKKKKVEVLDEEKETEKEEEEKEDIYSPSGWGRDTSSMYEIETPAEEETGLYQEEMETHPPVEDDLFSDIFAVGGTPGVAKAPPKTAETSLGDMDVDVDLPEEAMPSSAGEEEEEQAEVWGDVDEWEEEEDEWEELDEVEEEEWEDEDEDEWEDEEEEDEEEEWGEEDEEEEDILVISCRCGEEIEIPESRKNRRFKCPSCGRTGKLRK